jgi:hypothetical protein
MIIGMLVALLATAAITPGQRALLAPQTKATPGGMAYYLMSGNQIVGPAYPDPQSCAKALAAVQKTLPPGSRTVVCAHRIP